MPLHIAPWWTHTAEAAVQHSAGAEVVAAALDSVGAVESVAAAAAQVSQPSVALAYSQASFALSM